MNDDRAIRALTDVVAVERMAPGMVKVVTWSDAYPVDARGDGCNCPDKQYNEPTMCKHEVGAQIATTDLPGHDVTESLETTHSTPRVMADGGDCDECAALPDGWPCAECYIHGEKDITEGHA